MTSAFEEEIRSQGRLLASRDDAGRRAADVAAASWEGVTHVVVAGRGSSDHAAVFFQYLAGREVGLLVALATPSLYGGGRAIGLRGAGVLAISQSGRSPGLAEVVGQANAQGRPTVVVTNEPDSPLAHASRSVIDLAVGVERAVASTKTFSATWQAAVHLVGSLRQRSLEAVELLAPSVDEVATWALATAWPLSMLDAPRGITVIGRGIGYAVALEIALKIREVAGVRAEAFSVADFLHGPLGADGDGATLVVVMTSDLAVELAAEVVGAARRTGMSTVALRAGDSSNVGAHVDIELPVRGPDWQVGLAEVVAGQALALRLGERRQRSIDSPPGLSKVTLKA
ncbi:MAG: SIS domain-containing protein [Acidimicrobiales bacterium]